LCVTDKLLVVLQNCVYVPELVRGSYSEPFHHGNQFIRATFEVKEEPLIATMPAIKTQQQDPLPVTMPAMNTEHEVSFVSV
jgi:hypothetical protein